MNTKGQGQLPGGFYLDGLSGFVRFFQGLLVRMTFVVCCLGCRLRSGQTFSREKFIHGRIKIFRNWRSCRVTLPFYASGRIKTGISEHRTRTIKWLANRSDFFTSVINSWGLISVSVIANVSVVVFCFFIVGDPTAW